MLSIHRILSAVGSCLVREVRRRNPLSQCHHVRYRSLGDLLNLHTVPKTVQLYMLVSSQIPWCTADHEYSDPGGGPACKGGVFTEGCGMLCESVGQSVVKHTEWQIAPLVLSPQHDRAAARKGTVQDVLSPLLPLESDVEDGGVEV